MKRTLACPNLSIIGPDKANRGIPVMPPTVMVMPIKDLDAPKSSNNQNKNDSKKPHDVPKY